MRFSTARKKSSATKGSCDCPIHGHSWDSRQRVRVPDHSNTAARRRSSKKASPATTCWSSVSAALPSIKRFRGVASAERCSCAPLPVASVSLMRLASSPWSLMPKTIGWLDGMPAMGRTPCSMRPCRSCCQSPSRSTRSNVVGPPRDNRVYHVHNRAQTETGADTQDGVEVSPNCNRGQVKRHEMQPAPQGRNLPR
jgi:hypothetical protein